MSDKRILIVDDNRTNRLVLGEILKHWDVPYDEAQEGQRALEMLHQANRTGQPFDWVILDTAMPGMDGTALARAIKSDRDLASTRLILLSSLGKSRDSEKLRQMGFVAQLTKPIRRSLLLNCLIEQMGGDLENPVVTSDQGMSQCEIHTPTQQVRILLAEDNQTNQEVALGILNKLGYRAHAVQTGVEVIDVLKKEPYDIVLMDCQMPVLDGFATTAMIRDSKSPVLNHDVVIIALTAHAMKGDRELCMKAGMTDYMTKPVQPGELERILAKWTGTIIRTAQEDGHLDRSLTMKRHGSANDRRSEACIFNKEELTDRLMGDSDFLARVIHDFLKDIASKLPLLEQLILDGDVRSLRHEAHTIKGAADNITATALRHAASDLEAAAVREDLEGAKSLAISVHEEFKRLSEVLRLEVQSIHC